ncbi:protein of unknown function UPF0118 [Gloeothece citriformis PCC 7424]|uniref:Permease n=1 Tax=Gloeothece citriformis (strain PCC 7424) TaxID=65393 RepID=B7KJ92_GLOC7|nr:AI-2E family transporter [Gloeothece citriformis]ACK72176.1 protein of unknown function UPF0118 [Gloeothece citriformis PCC 7424]
MFNAFNHFPYWLRLGIIFPLAFLNGWLLVLLINSLEPLVSIFVTATLLAFLIDFPIRLLEQRGISRLWAVTLVFLMALVILAILSLILVPLIVQQLSELISVLPQWIETGSQNLEYLRQWAIAQNLPINLNETITQMAERLTNIFQSLSSQVLNFILSTIGSIFNIIFVLVLTVFLVFTGENLWEGLFSWLPVPWNKDLRNLIREKFEKYFASQAILAGILSLSQTLIFTVLNVPYSVLFGVTIGLTTLIPYASALTILLISIILSLENWVLGLKVLIAAIIIGQINDQVIAPRLMGGLTGLNPVWLIIALFIGGKSAGILGLLIAVPFASVIKNVADILKSKYINQPQN